MCIRTRWVAHVVQVISVSSSAPSSGRNWALGGVNCLRSLVVLAIVCLMTLFVAQRHKGLTFYKIDAPVLIAHGGGGLPEATTSNSLEALQRSKAVGFCLIEVDFDLSNDEVQLDRKMKDGSPILRDDLSNLTPMTLADLVAWMAKNPTIRIVTDTKDSNEKLIARLSQTGLKEQLIVQVYQADQYQIARNAGFDTIILTLYQSTMSDDEILEFAKANRPFAVTIPRKRATNGNLPERLHEEGVQVLINTINDVWEGKAFLKRGISGFYSDTLMPKGTSSC